MTEDWSKPLYVERLKDGSPLLDVDGNPIIMRGQKGEKLSWGCCAAKLPEFGPNTATHVTMRSDWWCESKEKYEALSRAGKNE